MSIPLYHGPPGSYKTSSAVEDYLIPAVLSGRAVFTNVRGSSKERILRVFGKDDLGGFFYNVGGALDDDSLALLRFFFLYVPRGALILFDEAQLIFPKHLKLSTVKSVDFKHNSDTQSILNYCSDEEYIVNNSERIYELYSETYPNYLDDEVRFRKFINELALRPQHLKEAFDKHRHYGWDIVLTMPNINEFSKELRGVSEVAYLQRNQAATFGRILKGKFSRTMHSPTNAGSANGNVLYFWGAKSISKKSFACYQSTSTGEISDTIAGSSIFSTFRFKFFAAAISLFIFTFVYILSTNGSMFYDAIAGTNTSGYFPENGSPKSSHAAVEAVAVDTQETVVTRSYSADIRSFVEADGVPHASSFNRSHASLEGREQDKLFHPFQQAHIYIDGYAVLKDDIYLAVTIIFPDTNQSFSFNTLSVFEQMGYQVDMLSTCIYKVYYNSKFLKYVYCSPREEDRKVVTVFDSAKDSF